MVAFARMNRILEIDLENERAVVEPGVVNLDITLAVQAQTVLLRAGSFQPARLHHRRQCRRERRRSAHPRLWRHHQSRAGRGSCAARRHDHRDRRQGARTCPGYDLDRSAHRLGRHDGAGHEGDRPADARARSWSRPSSPSTTHRRRRRHGRRDHGARDYAGCASRCSTA